MPTEALLSRDRRERFAESLQPEIEKLFDEKPAAYGEDHFLLFGRFKQALNQGEVRSAEPDSATRTGWRVNAWVKKGILLGFRMGVVVDMSPDPARLPMLDKSTWPVKRIGPEDGVRIVPGGSSIRDGCYIGKGVVCMPPMFINVGSWVGDGTIIDSHALVGSCAQIGSNCHISAAAQIGGVLEPVGAMPVIIEDEAVVGGNCGVYEGTVVKRRAVLASGTILTRSTPVYDVVRGAVYKATDDDPLVIPEAAVVVAGSRAIPRGAGKDWGISLYTPVIVKYRDSKTDARGAVGRSPAVRVAPIPDARQPRTGCRIRTALPSRATSSSGSCARRRSPRRPPKSVLRPSGARARHVKGDLAPRKG